MSFHDDVESYEGEDSEPQEGDWVTSDHATFREVGGRGFFSVSRDASTAQMWKAIDQRMKADGFYPNVWFESDHGNAHLMERPKAKGRRRR